MAIMKAFRKSFKKSVTTVLLLAGVGTASLSYSFVGGLGTGVGGSVRTPLHIHGSVVCTGCSLEEVRRAQPREHDFYQFSHKNGQLIFKVTSVDNKATFDALAWPPRLWVRAADETLRKLSAEENLFKPIGITGMLSSTRTLDIAEVEVGG
jgi:hypothetical protein